MWAAACWSAAVADSPHQTEQMMTTKMMMSASVLSSSSSRGSGGFGQGVKSADAALKDGGSRERGGRRGEKVQQDMSQTSVSSHKQWPQPGIHKFCQRRWTLCTDYYYGKVHKDHIFVVCMCVSVCVPELGHQSQKFPTAFSRFPPSENWGSDVFETTRF